MSPVVQMCPECRKPVYEGGSLHASCRRARTKRRNAVSHRAAHRLALHRRIRAVVLRRAKGRCWWCGGPADTCDYVKPLAEGGEMSVRNAVAACRSCNSRRGGQMTADRG